MDGRRLDYLEAIGVPVYVPRGAAAPEPSEPVEAVERPAGGLRLQVGPGAGSLLCVCAAADEPGSHLAADMARALGGPVVWAWVGGDADGATLADLVEQRPFNFVLVFGKVAVDGLFGASVPDSLGAARIVSLPGFDDLARSGEKRKECWQTLCRSGARGEA